MVMSGSRPSAALASAQHNVLGDHVRRQQTLQHIAKQAHCHRPAPAFAADWNCYVARRGVSAEAPLQQRCQEFQRGGPGVVLIWLQSVPSHPQQRRVSPLPQALRCTSAHHGIRGDRVRLQRKPPQLCERKSCLARARRTAWRIRRSASCARPQLPPLSQAPTTVLLMIRLSLWPQRSAPSSTASACRHSWRRSEAWTAVAVHRRPSPSSPRRTAGLQADIAFLDSDG